METLMSSNARMTQQIFSDTRSRKRRQPDLNVPEEVISLRRHAEYRELQTLPEPLRAQQASAASKRKKVGERANANGTPAAPSDEKSLQLVKRTVAGANAPGSNGSQGTASATSTSLTRLQEIHAKPKPDWHAPWKLHKVISGPLGWVRCVAMSPDNQWFAAGSGDRTIKIFDFPTGNLKLTLTGHISTVRGLVVSPRHPYLFSCGEDKLVKCFDLETNKVIRHYHGHLSGVYCIALHPTLDVLTTAGRDGVVRVWDIRTRSNVMTLSGHTGTVSSLITQEADPQVISGSLDSTIRMWDLAASKTMGVLTHHKKGVRSLTAHPTEFCFASASTGSIKQWKCPEGAFMQNFEGHNAIINTLSANAQNVLFSGADDGSMSFFDWKSGHRFQAMNTVAQPGSLDAENGVFCSTFDLTGLRLITGEADKTIKIWKEDEQATPETHPIG